MRASWFIVILFCLLGSSVANSLGDNHPDSHIPASYPQLETSYAEVPAVAPNDGNYISYRTEYIDRIAHEPFIVQKEIIVEKLVEKPIELREFVSLQELVDWLEQDETDTTLYFTVKVDLSNLDSKYDCDDFAYHLQKSALADGYLMSTEIIVKEGEQHMINSTSIGNNIYFIEPQTDEVWLGAYRD